MRRRAVLEQGAGPDIDVELELELDTEMMHDSSDQAHLSPTDEHDIYDAELASYLEEIQAKNRSQEFLFDDDLDGDEYDALFDQVLSQGGNGFSLAQSSDQIQATQAGHFAQQQQQSFDAGMDMS